MTDDVERICRLLCESDACDPDMLVLPTWEPMILTPFRRKMIAVKDLHPAWQLYLEYVQATLDAAAGVDFPTAAPDQMPAPTPAAWRERYHL